MFFHSILNCCFNLTQVLFGFSLKCVYASCCTTIDTHLICQEGGDLEKLKLRQKMKAREWDELMSTKKKMKVLEPVVKGCIWEGEAPGLQLFQPYAMCMVEPLPKADTSPSPEEQSLRCQREALCKCVCYMIHLNDLKFENSLLWLKSCVFKVSINCEWMTFYCIFVCWAKKKILWVNKWI